MNKRMRVMIIVLLIIFGGLIAFNLIKQSVTQYYLNHYQPPAVTVSAIQTKKSDWHPYLASIGTFIAENGVDVNTQSGGKVTAIHFTSGQYIEKGIPLIDIDDTVEQALLKFHQANLSLQKINYQRQMDLLKRNATALSNVDEARAKMLQATANVENTEATINLKHIKAPFSGMLGIRQIDLGQFIQPGVTNIVTLQSLDPIFLVFYVPEQYLNRIQNGQPIYFTLEQNPGIEFKGTITAINSKIDPKTHNIQVQATIDNCPAYKTNMFKDRLAKQQTDGRFVVMCSTTWNQTNKLQQFNFIPGMFAAIEIEQPVLHDVIVVPSTAISYSMYGDSVFVVETHKDEQQQEISTVKRVYVMTGETRGNYTVIKKGLESNQWVVTAGELKLQDNTAVIIDTKQNLIDHDNIELLGE